MIQLKHKLITMTTIAVLCSTAVAQGYFSSLVPDATSRLSARQLSLGMTHWGAEQSGNALTANPALLTSGGTWLRVSGGLIMRNIKEERSFPVQDSFDDYLADNIYVYNNLTTLKYNGYAVAGLGDRSALAINVAPYQVLDFDYEEEVRGSVYGEYNRDPLVGYHRMQNIGSVTGTSIGGSFQLHKLLTLGLSATLLTSDNIEQLYEIEAVEESDYLSGPDTTVSATAEIDPAIVFNAGLKFNLNRHLSVAVGYKSGYELVLDNPSMALSYDIEEAYPEMVVDYADTIKQMSIGQPAEYTLSLCYRPTNAVPTIFYLDLSFEPWEDVKAAFNDGADLTALGIDGNYVFQNTLKFRFGIEHNLFSGFPVRLGFYHEPSPLSDDLMRNWFTFGTAYTFDKLTLDLAGAFCKTEYNYPDMFPIETEERLDWDTVSNNFFTGKVSLTYEF